MYLQNRMLTCFEVNASELAVLNPSVEELRIKVNFLSEEIQRSKEAITFNTEVFYQRIKNYLILLLLLVLV